MRRILIFIRSIDSQSIQTIAAVANVVLAVAALAASMGVALYIHYGQTEATRLAYFHSLGETWVNIDLAALANDDLLVVADGMMDPANKSAQDINLRRKRWFAYTVMNAVLSRYKAAEDGILVPKREVLAGCRNMLATLMKDDDVYAITQGHGYEPWMSALCQELRDEYLASRPSGIDLSLRR